MYSLCGVFGAAMSIWIMLQKLSLRDIKSPPSESFPLATVPVQPANTMAALLTPSRLPNPRGIEVIKRWYCDIGRPDRGWTLYSKWQGGATPQMAADRSARTSTSIRMKCCVSHSGLFFFFFLRAHNRPLRLPRIKMAVLVSGPL